MNKSESVGARKLWKKARGESETQRLTEAHRGLPTIYLGTRWKVEENREKAANVGTARLERLIRNGLGYIRSQDDFRKEKRQERNQPRVAWFLTGQRLRSRASAPALVWVEVVVAQYPSEVVRTRMDIWSYPSPYLEERRTLHYGKKRKEGPRGSQRLRSTLANDFSNLSTIAPMPEGGAGVALAHLAARCWPYLPVLVRSCLDIVQSCRVLPCGRRARYCVT